MDVELNEVLNENNLHFGNKKLTINDMQSALEEDGWTLQ